MIEFDLKIFQYCPFDINAAGGVEKHIAFLSQELRKLNCHVSIGLKPDFDYRASGLLHSHGDRLPPADLLKTFGFKRWIHTFHGTSFGRAVACKEYLGLRNYLSSAKEAIAAHLAGGVICVSQGVYEQACRYFMMSANRNRAIIANAAPSGTVTRRSDSSSLKYQPYFLYLGRGGDRVKNTCVLQKAFQKMQQAYPQVKLLVAPGEGFNAGEGIVCLGSQSSQEVTDLLLHAQALVLPSLYEADSLVLWEAMALGTPLITTPIAGAKLLTTGYGPYKFVDTADSEGLCATMMEYLNHPPLRKPLVRTWDQVAVETAAFYEKTLKLP